MSGCLPQARVCGLSPKYWLIKSNQNSSEFKNNRRESWEQNIHNIQGSIQNHLSHKETGKSDQFSEQTNIINRDQVQNDANLGTSNQWF